MCNRYSHRKESEGKRIRSTCASAETAKVKIMYSTPILDATWSKHVIYFFAIPGGSAEALQAFYGHA